ncbi:MAG: hypothetical protein JXB07_03800 [Anaerolineae bacterium]|nr:hypothetical protein [Anaerolineae bacterium]
MMLYDCYKKFCPEEYVVEVLCIVAEYDGPYLCIGWYVEDPDPCVDWYQTDDGSSPKNRLILEGKYYMVSDYCWIGVN